MENHYTDFYLDFVVSSMRLNWRNADIKIYWRSIRRRHFSEPILKYFLKSLHLGHCKTGRANTIQCSSHFLPYSLRIFRRNCKLGEQDTEIILQKPISLHINWMTTRRGKWRNGLISNQWPQNSALGLLQSKFLLSPSHEVYFLHTLSNLVSNRIGQPG